MEFKEAYKKGLKVGKTITNGEYKISFHNETILGINRMVIKMNNLPDKTNELSLHKLFFDSFEDNWEILEED